MRPTRRRAALALGCALCAGLLLLFLVLAGRRLPSPPAAPPAALASSAALTSGEAPPAGLPIRLAPPPRRPEVPAAPGPARFEGRVVSAATRGGLPGAELSFARGGAVASVRAGPDGAFRFEPPSAGRWLLAAVTAPGHFPFAPEWGHSPVQLDAVPGRVVRGVEIHLAPAVALEGRVVDPDGAPVPGAEVRLLGAAAEAALVPIPDRFLTDAAGTFRAAAPERSVLEARRAGWAPGRAEVDALVLASGHITVALGPPDARPEAPRATLAGRGVAPDGSAAAGALVTATPAHAWGLATVPAAQAGADADGRFTLADLAPGPHRVEARAEGFAPAAARGVAGSGEEVVLQLGAGGRLRGCVRDGSGAPVAPFTVLVFLRRSALQLQPQRSLSVIDPGGCYALDDLLPGPAAVVFSAQGHAPSDELAVVVPPPPAEAELSAVLRAGGTLTGVVEDDATGAPVAGARLEVEGALSAAASTFPVLSEALTGPEGAFTLTDLPPRISLRAVARGYHARVTGGIEVAPGAEAGPLEVRLRPLAPGEEPRTDLVGIGVGLAIRGDLLEVTQVAPGGGAAQVGLAPGDLIVEVNGTPVADLGFGGAVDAIRGAEGTYVVLLLRRGGAALEVSVPRRLVSG